MKIGILGTGVVGEPLGAKLVKKGHQVKMGSRQAGNEKARQWAAFGEIVFHMALGHGNYKRHINIGPKLA